MEQYRFTAFKKTLDGPMTTIGLIEAKNPFSAIEMIVEDLFPKSVYSATLQESKKNTVIARYVSSSAATEISAPTGFKEWKQDGLYVNGEKVTRQPERYYLTN